MHDETLVIASAADEKFATGLGVMMCSAVLCSKQKSVRFHIVDGGILPETKALLLHRLRQIAAPRGTGVELNFIDFDRIKLPDVAAYFGSILPYARVFLPDLLDEREFFYVDADIVCNREFPSFEEVRRAHPGRLAVAVHDSVIKELRNDCPWLDRVDEKDHGRKYVNTGFMWMDLEGLRKFRLQEKFAALAGEGKPMKFADQTALNFLLMDHIGLMDPDFNRLLSYFSDLDAIGVGSNMHFVGPEKPWIDPQGKSLYLYFPVYGIAASYFGFTGPGLAKVAAARIPISVYYHAHVRFRILWFTSSKKRRRKCAAFRNRFIMMTSLTKKYRQKFQSLPPSPFHGALSSMPGGVP